MKFGDKLRLLRGINGISQEYMANCLNVSQSTYSRYELGCIKPDIDKMSMILNILDIDFIDLTLMNVDNIFTHRPTLGRIREKLED